MTATAWQQREIELLSQLRAKDVEIADLRARLQAFRQRVSRMLALAESELHDLDHPDCADIVYAIGVGITIDQGAP